MARNRFIEKSLSDQNEQINQENTELNITKDTEIIEDNGEIIFESDELQKAEIKEEIQEQKIEPIANQSATIMDGNEYLRIVNEYNGELQNKNRPIYNYSKNYSTGEIKINPKNPSNKKETTEQNVSKVENNYSEKYMNEVKKLIDKTEEDLIRINIEIKIHSELIANEVDSQTKKLYQSKLESYVKDINYFNKRLSILKKI